MSNPHDGGPANPPAFPQLGRSTEQYFNAMRGREEERELLFTNGGMSLRDYFAAQAMPELVRIYEESYPESGNRYVNQIANASYVMADAMLRARAAKSPADTMREHLNEFGK